MIINVELESFHNENETGPAGRGPQNENNIIVCIHSENENGNSKMGLVAQKVIIILQKVIFILQEDISQTKMSLPPPPCRIHSVRYGYPRIWVAATSSFHF